MKILLIVVALAMVCSYAFAETTEGTSWKNSSLAPIVDSYLGHDHEYEGYDMPAGVGLNAILYEFNDNVSVGAEAKYDFNNQEPSVFGVVNVNLYRMLMGK